MTVEEIIRKCAELKNTRITFTGGEPLLQKDALNLVETLMNNGYEVNIETNGSISLRDFISKLKTNSWKNLFFTMDYKTASSGEEDKMDLDNLKILNSRDVLKFVVGTVQELDKMKQIITEYKPNGHIFVSPIFGKIEPKQLVDYVLENNLQNVRVQVQLHKIIWSPETRGV